VSGIYAGMSLFGFDPLALVFHTAVTSVNAPELIHTIPDFVLVDPMFYHILQNIVEDITVHSGHINKLLRVLGELNEN